MSENTNIPGRNAPPKTPRWVKLFIVILLLLVGIVVIAHLAGFRVNHGTGQVLDSFVWLIELIPQTL